MSMICGQIICIENVGSIERGTISPGKWYTIDKIILKTVDGKRKTRYAVCENGTWKTNQRLTLREARNRVAELHEEYIASKYYAMYI